MCDEDELRLEVLNHLPLVSRQNPLRSAGLWAGDTLVGALQESLDLIGAIWLLTQESELLIEGLATRWTVAGLDAIE